jgi:hypothetical protein
VTKMCGWCPPRHQSHSASHAHPSVNSVQICLFPKSSQNTQLIVSQSAAHDSPPIQRPIDSVRPSTQDLIRISSSSLPSDTSSTCQLLSKTSSADSDTPPPHHFHQLKGPPFLSVSFKPFADASVRHSFISIISFRRFVCQFSRVIKHTCCSLAATLPPSNYKAHLLFPRRYITAV